MTTSLIDRETPSAVQPQTSASIRILRSAYLLCVVLFAGGVALQVFFAGAALLVNSSYLIQHRSFAHTLELLTFAIPIVALVARLPRRLALLSWLPLVLFLLQYVFLYAITPMGLPISLRALHAVNALLIFGNAVYLAKSAWRFVRGV